MRITSAVIVTMGVFFGAVYGLFAQETSFPQKMPAETNETPDNPSYEEMTDVFANPFGHVRTAAYWYWLAGHFSKEGVEKDLQAMKSIGIDRAQIGDIGDDTVERGPGRTFSPLWWDAIHAALKTATDLDVEIGIFNSPGWSQSGGPWVTPERAMRYLASSTRTVTGPVKFSEKLEVPGKGLAAEEFRDVKVLAYPALPKEKIVTVICDPGGSGLSLKSDEVVSVPLVFEKPVKARSLVIQTLERATVADGTLFVKKGDSWEKVTDFLVNRFNPSISVGFVPFAPTVVSFPAAEGNEFRVDFKADPKQSGSAVRLIQISTQPFIGSFYEKTLAKLHQTPHPMWTEYQWDPEAEVDDPELLVDPEKVIDLTDKMTSDGVLTWDVPAGDWVILRTGMTPTGQKNAPAVPEATGYETDKMSREHIQYHFDAMMGEVLKRVPEGDRKSFKYVVQDSYEVGGQNFTDHFFEKFEKEFGYDPTPWLPVFFGTVVADTERSNRFLWDLRRFIADEVAYSYVGGLRDASNEHGLKTWLECYGHWGFCGEFLQYGGQSNEVAGEYWSEGTLGDIENRIASSCGHIYGKKHIWAESNTAAGEPFGRGPVKMKVRTDRFFSEGINSSLLHLFIEQPDERAPGINAWFGNEFNRHNTWFPMLDLFTGYLKRSNYLLQQGLNVADVAYFIGEDAPKMMGIVDPELPNGYQFDFMNAEVIESSLFVKDGHLALPNGAEYRILVLPKLETMRPKLLKKITELVENGAVVMGPKPVRSPSMENYPAADQEVKSLADALWGNVDGETVKYRQVGKGIIASGMTMQEIFDMVNLRRDCEWPDSVPLVYGHRHLKDAEIYFVANQSQEQLDNVPVQFRTTGKNPECWNPIDGSKRELPVWSAGSNSILVPLSFAPQESYFIVFAKGETTGPVSQFENFPVGKTAAELKGPWTVTFNTDEIRRGPKDPVVFETLSDWAQSKNDEIKYFSGTAVYAMKFNLPSVSAKDRLVLGLGKVAEIAKVRVNGKEVGGVWTFPYEVDITSAAQEGENTVEIEVANCWRNRLVGDARDPENRKTWILLDDVKADDDLVQSGLLGPVTVKVK